MANYPSPFRLENGSLPGGSDANLCSECRSRSRHPESNLCWPCIQDNVYLPVCSHGPGSAACESCSPNHQCLKCRRHTRAGLIRQWCRPCIVENESKCRGLCAEPGCHFHARQDGAVCEICLTANSDVQAMPPLGVVVDTPSLTPRGRGPEIRNRFVQVDISRFQRQANGEGSSRRGERRNGLR